MRAYDTDAIKLLVVCLLLGATAPSAADPGAMSGTWVLDERASESLKDEIIQLKQEYRDWKTSEARGSDPTKPDPFSDKRKFSDKEWNAARGGAVGNASVKVRQMVSAESIKLYVSTRVIVAYDGQLKRLVSPNPAGRVHSASGKGVSTDAVGETLAYVDGDAVVIETRSNSAERLAERFELTSNDQLQITTSLKNPDWRRGIEFVRFYDRD